MKTIETKISKSGATIYYVDGKRTSRENAMFIQRMNDAEARRLAKIEAEKAERENELATVNNEVADGGKTFTTVKADPLNALDTADYAVTVDAFNFAVDNEIEEAEIAAAESRAIARILANDNLAARYEKAKSQVKCERYENGYFGWYFKGKHSDDWEHDETKAAACLTRYGLSRFEFSVLSEDETAVINSNGYDESAFDLLPTVDELNDVEIDDEAKTVEPEITDETDEDKHNMTEKIEVAIGADAVPAMIDLFEPNKITLNTPAQILKLIEDAAGNSFSFDYESYFINTDDDTRHKFITRHFVSECKNYSFIEIFTDDGKLDCVEFLKHFLAGYKEVKFYLAAPAQDNVDVEGELVNRMIDNFKQANELTAKLLKATETAGYKSVTCQDGLTILAHFKGAKVTSDNGYDILTAWDRLLGHYDTPAQVTAVINLIKVCVDGKIGSFAFPTVDELEDKPAYENKRWAVDFDIYHTDSDLTDAELEAYTDKLREALTANGNRACVELEDSLITIYGDNGGDNTTVAKIVTEMCKRDCWVEYPEEEGDANEKARLS